MGVEIHELMGRDGYGSGGCILLDNTTGAVFGFVFGAEVDGVDAFLTHLRETGRDARDFDNEALAHEFETFKAETFKCGRCGVAGDVTCVNVYRAKCGGWFCSQHDECETWTADDGTEYGHNH